MAEFGDGGFNAEAPENNPSVIPAGEYEAMLIKSAKTATKAGDGHYLKLEFQIVSGEFQNTHLFENLNVWLAETDEKKKKAVQIAKGNLSELCRAVGVLNPQRSEELHNKPLRIKVKVDEGNAQFGKQNRVTGFKPRNFTATPETATTTPSPAPAVPAGANPW